MKILFLCSGASSCRSLIAKTVLESFDENLEVFAAGTEPVSNLNPLAFEVMKSVGFTMDKQQIRTVSQLGDMSFDYVITVCEGTKEEFGSFSFNYRKKLHLGFTDPGKVTGDSQKETEAYLHFIEEVKAELDYFYQRILKGKAAS